MTAQGPELRALADTLREAGEKAADGPWEAFSGIAHDGVTKTRGVCREGDEVECVFEDRYIDPSDATLIVLLRNNLPTIISALERAAASEGEKAEVDKETFPWAEHPRSCAASSPGYWKWQGDLRVLKVPCTCVVGTASS